MGHTYSPPCDIAVYINVLLDKVIVPKLEAKIMKIVPKDSKLMYAINILLKLSCFLVFSYDSHLNTMENSNTPRL